jgi:hypothetical protein
MHERLQIETALSEHPLRTSEGSVVPEALANWLYDGLSGGRQVPTRRSC